ncbi:MAG: hypothetical protein KME16_09140 [Scytolyngbya sp. HA4215-MV1]|jgi:hypothetical protein|nr:hypothetical protein [Scytolyngbya sp. HA4215-MV1]
MTVSRFIDLSDRSTYYRVETILPEQRKTFLLLSNSSKTEGEIREKFQGWEDVIKALSIYGMTSIILSVIVFALTFPIFNPGPNTTQEDKNWARTNISAIATGILGFLCGKRESGQQNSKESDSE